MMHTLLPAVACDFHALDRSNLLCIDFACAVSQPMLP
jgi:hypothetical protein